MNQNRESAFGRVRSKREVIDVAEEKKKDKSLDKLMGVRKQRLERYERERREAREAWRAARLELSAIKERWRTAVEEAQTYWQQERAQFFTMAITSGQFRKAKAIYDRLKMQAEQLHLESREAVSPCRLKGKDYFQAKDRVLDASRQKEKLTILCDEIRMLENLGNAE